MGAAAEDRAGAGAAVAVLPATPARRSHDYVRNGTTSLFAALEVASGPVIAQPCRQHRHQEFLRFLKLIDAAVPRDYDLHLILDNYVTRKTPEVKKCLLRHPRFHAPVDQRLAQEPPAIHLDQNPGRDLRVHRRVLPANQ